MEQTVQYVTRKHRMDYGHRVVAHINKCSNQHGHDGHVELTFSFTQAEDIGYAIDFAELKRVGCAWIDDMWDHGVIYNPTDEDFIAPVRKHNKKLWLMSLNGEGEFCNPTAENISKELFMVMEILFEKYTNLNIHHIRFFETPNCYTDCYKNSILESERKNFYDARYEQIKQYAEEKGIVEYDNRKCGV